MERSQELLERLKAADDALSTERMSRAGSRRVARHLSRELDSLAKPSRVGWIPMLTFVAGAVLVLLFLRWSTAPVPSTSEAQARPEMAVFVSGADCDATTDRTAETTTTHGACRIATSAPSMTIDTIDGTELEVADRVVRLRAGSALFDVDKVRGEPIRVAVPQGEIVIVGTRFRVVVTGVRTEVELYEGELEFHDDAGKVTPIFAGQLVGFGGVVAPPSVKAAAPPAEPRVEKTPAVTPAPPAARPKPAAERSPTENDAGPVIEEAERFRREGRYAEAAGVLRRALKRRWPSRTADVLSYELGRILERRMKDTSAACEHWRAHLKRFERTRYRARIERSMNSLDCESSSYSAPAPMKMPTTLPASNE